QTLLLDTHGYVTTAFVPGTAIKKSQPLKVTIVVTRGSSHQTVTRSLTLLPGHASGPVPLGAPPLSESLSASRVRAGAPGPVITVQTAAGAQVRVGLRLAGKPLSGVRDVASTATKKGSVQLHLPSVSRTLLSAHLH